MSLSNIRKVKDMDTQESREGEGVRCHACGHESGGFDAVFAGLRAIAEMKLPGNEESK